METIKDLAYWKNNCEEDYLTTPISVLRYITELEKSIQLMQTAVSKSFYCLDERHKTIKGKCKQQCHHCVKLETI